MKSYFSKGFTQGIIVYWNIFQRI